VLAELPQVGSSLQPAIPPRQLWLSVHLPALPLEALLDTATAAAVFEDRQGLRKVLLANGQARAAGIGPGLTVNAALALLPTVHLGERNPLREAEVLRAIAAWAEGFTSLACIEPPAVLLLEIAGSLKLFGGIRTLRQRIVDELDSQGFAASVAIAPTPLAATWLARAGQRACIRDPRNLVGRLGLLPLGCAAWPQAVCTSLEGMGVTTIGEALRLPRSGFAKRFGAARLLELDRAAGRLPDPRASYRAAERFIADFDLSEEQDDAGLLLNACHELLLRLERFLLRRQLAVQYLEFSFFHLQVPATPLSLGCVQPDRAVQHWFSLLEIRFERLALPAPVIAIRLCAGQGQPFTAQTENLKFKRRESQPQNTPITHLAERLSARIGEASVHGVMTVAEYRPQYAWQLCSNFAVAPHCTSTPLGHTNSLVVQRPLWILEEPRRLETHRGVPCYQGPLQLLGEPERLETGWWDGEGIARDYFAAVNPKRVHLWVYRNRGKDKDHWYLHGMFG